MTRCPPRAITCTPPTALTPSHGENAATHTCRRDTFEADVRSRLNLYLNWIGHALAEFSTTRYRKPTDLYSLLGALEICWDEVRKQAAPSGARLTEFEKQIVPEATGDAGRYFAAASRQTDNLKPRETRIEILAKLLRG